MNLLKNRDKTADRKGNELSEEEKLCRALGQFKAALEHIESYAVVVEGLDNKTLNERKQSFTDGYLNILRKSLFYDYVLGCIGIDESEIPGIYPRTENKLPSTKLENFNLKDKCILMHYRKPWSVAAQCKMLQDGKPLRGEKYCYYEKLGIGYPKFGNHRVISAAMKDHDLIADEVEVLDDQILIDTLEIREMHWYRKGEDVSLGDVTDYRIALIFVILQETQNCWL